MFRNKAEIKRLTSHFIDETKAQKSSDLPKVNLQIPASFNNTLKPSMFFNFNFSYAYCLKSKLSCGQL